MQDCTVCNGTGEDPDFGGTCSMCDGFIPGLGGVGETTRLRQNNGPARSTVKTDTVDDEWKRHPRWKKLPGSDQFVVIVPKAIKVAVGDEVQVRKSDGTFRPVVLGALFDRDDWGSTLYFAAPKKDLPAPPKNNNSASGLDLWTIPAGRYAVPGGDTRLRVWVKRAKNKWDGWIFVEDAAVYGEGQKYGSQRPGERYNGKIETQLAAILADPITAAEAYGALTSHCSMCNRALELEQSVERGMGSKCYAKYFGEE